jgi:hypothetical protein
MVVGKNGILVARAAAATCAVALPILFIFLCFNIQALRNIAGLIAPFSLPALFVASVVCAIWLRAKPTLPQAASAPEGALSNQRFMRTCVALAATIILFFLPLLQSWTSPIWDGCTIGGFLPFSDSADYYGGAMSVQLEGKLNSWNSRRPLNALLLCTRLAATGGDLQYAILMQAALAALAAFCLARAIARDFGFAAGLMTVATIYSLGYSYLPLTLSESLGLTLGTLAATFLWIGAREERRSVALTGLFVMTVALNARAGAFFVLPALVLWLGFAFKKEGRFSFSSAALGFAAVAAAFLFNLSVLALYSNTYETHGNFAYVLYGFSRGYPDWSKIYVDYPESRQFTDKQMVEFCYEKAWQNIRSNPFMLVKGLIHGVRIWAMGLGYYLAKTLQVTPWWLLNIPFALALFAASAKLIWTSRTSRVITLYVFALAGFLISGPIIFADGGRRCLIASGPLFFVIASVALGSFSRRKWSVPTEPPPVTRSLTYLPGALAAGLMLAALVGPSIISTWNRAADVPLSLEAARQITLIKVGPDTPRMVLLPNGSSRTTFAPYIRVEDFVNFLKPAPFQSVPGINIDHPEARVLVLAYNLAESAPGCVFVALPSALLTDEWHYLSIPRQPRAEGQFWFCDGTDAEIVK